MWMFPTRQRAFLTFLYVLCKGVAVFLDVMSTLMLVRVILPFIVNPEESRLYLFVATATEIFVYPVRFVFDALNLFSDSPLDMAFLFSYFLLVLLRMFLPAL